MNFCSSNDKKDRLLIQAVEVSRAWEHDLGFFKRLLIDNMDFPYSFMVWVYIYVEQFRHIMHVAARDEPISTLFAYGLSGLRYCKVNCQQDVCLVQALYIASKIGMLLVISEFLKYTGHFSIISNWARRLCRGLDIRLLVKIIYASIKIKHNT